MQQYRWACLLRCSPATTHFEDELKEHSCALNGFTNIAVGGTTAKQWSGFLYMEKVKKQVCKLGHMSYGLHSYGLCSCGPMQLWPT